MSVKTDVIKTLEENRGSFFSGEELAKKLDVSRAAVWKAIKQLENEGYVIEAATNKGYRLALNSDVLSAEGIKTYLAKEYEHIEINVDQITGSTNLNAKLCAAHGGKHGTVYVAEEQTAGRGRRGRSFVSMKGNSIYMSVLLKPEVSASNAIFITTAASVAVFRAILKVTGKETKIKWVNDLYYEDKKVCGILTEAVTDCESGMIDSIILGIGINFNIEDSNVPEELKGIAGALYHGDAEDVTRNQLIAEIINQVLVTCMELKDRSFLEEYREHSMVLGKDISVIGTDEPRSAKAIGIDENGGLIVKYEDETIEVLNTGEISIRVK